MDLIQSDASRYDFTGNVRTLGGTVSIQADTIRVAAGAGISTRVTGADGVSTADSGDITLVAETITVEAGAVLESFDDRPSTATTGPAGAIKDISYPPVELNVGGTLPVWAPGYVFRNVSTHTTKGGGSGLTVDLVVDRQGDVLTLMRSPGTGYRDGDSVWVELQDLGSDQIYK